MKFFFVYKVYHCRYTESRGMLIKTTSWQRAKGIAMSNYSFEGHHRNDVEVVELEDFKEGIICQVDFMGTLSDSMGTLIT